MNLDRSPVYNLLREWIGWAEDFSPGHGCGELLARTKAVVEEIDNALAALDRINKRFSK